MNRAPIMPRLQQVLVGDGLRARALRGSALTFVGFGGAQFLRLVSNLVLTRLLFPEVFGLMALVQVFIVGLELFSDMGVKTSIMQNARGDDPDFLNTAWTFQILRGGVLWILTCAIAIPAGHFYDSVMLPIVLPVVGLSAILRGLESTNMMTANRNLMLGRLTALELGTNAAGIMIMVFLAWWLQSVWALVFGGLFSGMLRMALSHIAMPGISNRLHLDKGALSNLFHFGKFIFLSSAAGFLISSADRVVLGRYVSLGALGIYNVAFFLGSMPLMLCIQLSGRIMLPLYRECAPSQGAHNRAKIARARTSVSISMLGLCFVTGLLSVPVIDLLYDPRYVAAGPMLAAMSVAVMPGVLFSSYGGLFLAEGSSAIYAIVMCTSAVLRLLLTLIGVQWVGIPGVMAATFASELLVYPMSAHFLRKFQGWDPRHDAIGMTAVCGMGIVVLWLHWDGIIGLTQIQ